MKNLDDFLSAHMFSGLADVSKIDIFGFRANTVIGLMCTHGYRVAKTYRIP